VRPQAGTGLTPYMWEQLFHNPAIALPMWEQWWLRNRLHYLPFKDPITWLETNMTGETMPVSVELRKNVFDIITKCAKEDKDLMVRATAVLALGKSRDKNIIPVLREVFKSDKKSEARDVASLSACIQGDESDVKNIASLALGIMGDESVLNDFKSILANQKASSQEIISQSYTALSLGYIKNNDSIEILKEILNRPNKPNNELQCSALLSLGNLQDKSLIPFISKILTDLSRNDSVRSYAALALGRIKDPAALPELRKALQDKKSSVRASAAIALGLIESIEAKDDLINLLTNDKISEVRSYAAISLAQLGDKSVYSIISKFAKKGDYHLENMCTLALGILGNPEAIPELRELVEKKNKPLSYGAAILALGLLKDKSSVPNLIKIVEKESADTTNWCYAIQSLGMIGDAKAIPVLKKVFKTELTSFTTLAYSDLIVALTLLGKRQEILSLLHERLKNESLHSEIQYRILHGLAYIGDKTSLEHLVKFYNEQRDNYLRMYTVFALGYILDKNKISPLYKITADTNFDIWLDIIDQIAISKPD